MFLIIKFFFLVIFAFVMLAVFTGVSVFLRIRRNLINPFERDGGRPVPPAGDGDIIEGEYKVLDETRK